MRRAFDPGSLLAVPLPNGMFGVVWLLEVATYDTRGYVQFLIMDGFHSVIPKGKALAGLRAAECPGGGLDGEDVWKGCFFGGFPKDFTFVGKRALPPKGHPFFAAEGTMVFQSGEHTRKELHRAWLLIHDRAAVEAEWAKAAEARKKNADARRRIRTLPRMLRERVFPSWTERWPPRALREARRIFRDATRDLIALQGKGTKRQRTAVLKRIVTELNVLDDQEGNIETVEREQIVARIEELAALVGLSNEDEALSGHRDW